MSQAIVTASRAKLATHPGGETVAVLRRDNVVTVRGGPAAWVEVEFNGQSGTVSRSALTSLPLPTVKREGPVALPAMPPEAVESDIRIAGKQVLGPDGKPFGTLFKLGLFNYGRTSLDDFFQQDPAAFPDLSPSVKRVMRSVSANEGKIEAINTWDSAFLSCGIYQWTAGQENAAGELAALLTTLKSRSPETFAGLFGQYGLDVVMTSNAAGKLGTGFLTLKGSRLDGAVKKAVLRQPIWAYRFWRAAHDMQVRRAQVEMAIGRIDIFYRAAIPTLKNRPVSAYVTSQHGVALLLDQHVNRPGHLPKTLVEAINTLTAAGGQADPAKWTTDDEQAVLRHYLLARAKTSMTNSDLRARTIADAVKAGQLSAERGSF